MDQHDTFKIGPWQVDPNRDRISCGQEWVTLRPLVMDLLVCLARSRGEVVSNDELLEAVWKGKVVTQSSIYNCLNELRRALGDNPQDPTYIRTIPKRGYRLIVDVIHDDSQSKAASTSALESDKTSKSPPSFNSVMVVVLLSAMAIWLAWINMRNGENAARASASYNVPRSVAVMPFTNMSEDPDQLYLSDGLSEEILDRLAQLPDLKVIGPKSTFAFREIDATETGIGEVLGVAHLLEGSILREGDRIRVAVQLLRTEDDFHLWSQEYDRGVNELIAIQDDITHHVAKTLQLDLGGRGSSVGTAPIGPLNPDFTAYELYLQARELINENTKPSLMGALMKLEKALENEPDFAPAHVAMALAYVQVADFDGYFIEAMKEVRPLAQPHLEKAIALDPNLAEAYAVLGRMYIISWNPQDWQRAEDSLRKAISLNPNLAQAHSWLGLLQRDQLVSWRAPVVHHEKALEVEPLWIEAAQWMIAALRHLPHRRDEARSIVANLKARFPDHPTAIYFDAFWQHFEGNTAQAVRQLESLSILHPDYRWTGFTLGRAWAALGEFEKADSFAEWSREWRFVLNPDRENGLRNARELDEDIESEGILNFARSAYIYVMFQDWQSVIDILPSHMDDLESFREQYQADFGKEDSPALSLATAYKALGDTEQFERWTAFEEEALNTRTENGRIRNYQYSRVKARLLALRGDHYQALLELERLVTTGPMDPRDLMHPAFDELRTLPEFRRVKQLQLDRVNAEREKLGLEPLADDQWPVVKQSEESKKIQETPELQS